MPFLRSSHLLVALTLLGGSTCSKPESGEVKPAVVPEVTLTGVDTSPLTPRERRDWAAQVSELLAPCADTPVNIAQCVKESRPCKTCLPAAQFLLKQVRAGRAKKDREDAFHARFDANKVKTVVTDGSPEMGPPDAVVTIVEWADFECPHCRSYAPALEDLVRRFPGQVRLVYKVFPLQIHPHGEVSARAAIAAANQGKFWEMHHLLFENQDRLEPADLERYAKQAGLDLAKFRTDFGSKEVGERVEKDKKQAEELGLDGTPFIFINGRNLGLQFITDQDDLVDWVKLEIELAGKVPKQVAPSASGAPSALAPIAPPSTSASAAPPGKK